MVGPRITALRVPVAPGWDYWGVRFVPGVIGGLLGVRAADLREKVVGLGQVAPPAARLFAESMARQAGVEGLTAVVEEWVREYLGRIEHRNIVR
ncbi:MAG: hypothetical protein U0R19_24790 [Bryobacteraceae bacterium]